MEKLFQNKVVMISGGLGDIGRAIAMAFAKQGASVALCDIREVPHAHDFLTQLQAQNIIASYSVVDVADAAAVKQWIQKVEADQGVPAVVVANAATVTIARMHEVTPDQWSKEMAVNLGGAFYLTQLATERMIHHKQAGRVVFMGSWAGYTPHAHIPTYCVSKAGMRMLCKCMALELAPHGILVNEIAPGFVNAGLSGSVWGSDEAKAKEALNKVPIHKLISAEAVAQQVLTLCHPDNEHMTGSTILMDGGLSLLS